MHLAGDSIACARLCFPREKLCRVLQVTAEQVLAATPDPVARFAPQVAEHMNKGHQDALIAMVKHFTGLTVDEVGILTMDHLGMDCTCTKDRQPLKCRLPYTR